MLFRRFFIVCAFFAMIPATAQLYDSYHSFYRMRTNHFDFIYPPESEQSARFVARYADGMFDRLCSLVGISPDERIPVTFTPDTERLNAYFSYLGHNHIVMFDTVPSDGALFFEDHLLTVFYHELTHAFTALCRSKGWDVMSTILGDSVAPALTAKFPTLFTEGFTVSFESMTGQGRVNDPYVRQFIMQAKIDGNFPSWGRVSGASDEYVLRRFHYYYGGMFCDYLRTRYGMEKLSAFMRSGSYYIVGGTIQKRFYTAFGVTLDDAWCDFETSIMVPQLASWKGCITGNDSMLITAMCGGGGANFSGTVFYDELSSAVYSVEEKRNADIQVEPHHLFTATSSVEKLSLSRDGRYLLVSSIDETAAASVNVVRLYDIVRERFTDWKQEHYREAVFVTLSDGSEAVCAVHTDRCNLSLVIFEDERFETERTVWAFPSNVLPCNLCAGADGYVSYLSSQGLNRRAVTCSIDTALSDYGTETELFQKLPYMRYLSSFRTDGVTRYVFAWSHQDSMYRLAVTDSDGTIHIQTADVSGGVHYPVINGDTVTFFSRHDSTGFLSNAPITAAPGWAVASINKNFNGTVDYGTSLKAVLSAADDTAFPVQRYNPLPSLFSPLFLPFATINESTVNPAFFMIGIDSTERWHTKANAVFDIDRTFLSYNAELSNTSLPVTFSIAAADSLTLKQKKTISKRTSLYSLSAAWSAYAGIRNVQIAGKTITGCKLAYQGLTSDYNAAYNLPLFDVDSAFFVQQSFAVSNKTRKGIGAFDYFSQVFSLTGQGFRYFAETAESTLYSGLGEVSVSFHVPGLLPVHQTGAVCLSLPLDVTASSVWTAGRRETLNYNENTGLSHTRSYSNDSVYNDVSGDMVSGGWASLLLFGVDIQKPFFGKYLYARRFTVCAEYGCYGFWNYDTFDEPVRTDFVAGVATLELSPILGTATGLAMKLNARFEYGIASEEFHIYIGGIGIW